MHDGHGDMRRHFGATHHISLMVVDQLAQGAVGCRTVSSYLSTKTPASGTV